MDDDQRELLRRLFVLATERLETAHEAATAGQSGDLADEGIAEAVNALQAAARDVAKLADAMTVIVGPGNDGHPDKKC